MWRKFSGRLRYWRHSHTALPELSSELRSYLDHPPWTLQSTLWTESRTWGRPCPEENRYRQPSRRSRGRSRLLCRTRTLQARNSWSGAWKLWLKMKECFYYCIVWSTRVKAGTHYPCSRPVNTGVFLSPVFAARVHEPAPVNTGSVYRS